MSVSLDTLYTAETPEGIALSLRPAGVVARAERAPKHLYAARSAV
jgi:hypothetical protein